MKIKNIPCFIKILSHDQFEISQYEDFSESNIGIFDHPIELNESEIILSNVWVG